MTKLLMYLLIAFGLLWAEAGLLLAQSGGAGRESQRNQEVEVKENQFKSVRQLYLEANRLFDRQYYSDAISKYQSTIQKQPSSLLASYAYLRTAEANEHLKKWAEAEVNYRQFSLLQPNNDLSDLIHFRLVRTQYEQSLAGRFNRGKKPTHDMQVNREIIQDAARFFLLYPNSVHLEEVQNYYQRARQALAKNERQVADFYFKNRQYHAASQRYLFLLKHYPEYPESPQVLTRLIESYRLSRQLHRAAELEKIRTQLPSPADNS